MTKYRSCVLVTLMAFVAISTSASGKSVKSDRSNLRLLKGDYFFTQTNHCVSTRRGSLPPTFDETTLSLVGPAEVVTIHGNGVTTFDGRGGFKVRGTAMALFHSQVDAGDSPIGPPLPVECSGAYSVDRKRQFMLDGSCTTPFFKIERFRIGGSIGKDKETLIFSDAEPLIEKITADGNLITERVCVAMATDVRAKK